MQIYTLDNLLDKKLKAAYDGATPRTVMRDLYDIWFISKNHIDTFSEANYNRLRSFANNIGTLGDRYEEA
jgi:predicted nucleotidyltransferase component of viral defense system